MKLLLIHSLCCEMVINVFVFLDVLTAINNAIELNKNASKILKFCVLQVIFFIKVFVSSLQNSITSSHIRAESSIIIAKYFLFSQDSKHNIFHIHDVFYTHIDIYHYSTIDLNYIFFRQIYICIPMLYVLLMILIHLFL